MIPGYFPKDMPDVAPFDVITMLACLEHIPNEQLDEIKAGCAKFLKSGGRLIITIPSPLVDGILTVLKALLLVDGLSFEEHHGYRVSMTEEIFDSPTFHLAVRHRFQLGLNNLFVFVRS
jgi:2-polyprenyl-3-methyl-5-hydroxy-6-metoxy-1,4-benzoquinol methylase